MASASVSRLKRKLPERLAQVRGTRSQRQFARDLGVFQQNVNRYESGTTPHTDFLITLALKENVSIDWLLLGKGKMRRSRSRGASRPAARSAPTPPGCRQAPEKRSALHPQRAPAAPAPPAAPP